MALSVIGDLLRRQGPSAVAGLSEMSGRLESYLIQQKLVGADMCARAADLSLQTGRSLGVTLVDMGVLSEETLFVALSAVTGMAVWDGRGDFAELAPYPQEFLLANNILPIQTSEGRNLLLVGEVEDPGLLDLIRRTAPDWELGLFAENEIRFRLESHYQLDHEADTVELFDSLSSVEHLKDLALEAPIIRMVNDIIGSGVRMGASDIHLEPSRSRVELRYRVDGVLHSRPPPAFEDYPAVVSRLKILSQLDIAERRVPQDGRIKLRTGGKDVDIRVSTIPTNFGEDIALRLLDQKKQVLDLDTLGFSTDFVSTFRSGLRHSHGLVLVTGPTGSGKSTCLYAGLRDIIDGRTKIITVEDPIEYEIPSLTQIQVNHEIGVDFASALRSILRHDPDVIFVGEIRDRETAEIAVQSALTGHLVLSTIHTNSALSAIDRLLNMGIPDYLISSSLLMVTGQRLLRKLCPHCRRSVTVDSVLAERYGLPEGATVYEAVGCPDCGGIGYRHRMPINEVLTVSADLRHLILVDRSASRMMETARAAGYVTMVEDGMAKVVQGLTTIEEVLRVAR